jgi:hypothetical protein
MHLPLKVYLKEQKEVYCMLKIIEGMYQFGKNSQKIIVQENTKCLTIRPCSKYLLKNNMYIGIQFGFLCTWKPLGFERSILYR